jgi:hypothetical protein
MKYFFSLSLLTFIFFGVAGSVFAAESGGTTQMDSASGGTTQMDPYIGGVTGGDPVSVVNPLEADNITQLFQDIIDILLVFAIPLIVFFIIYAGFLYVTARGNESTISKAHMALLYALIGGVLILGAKVLIEVISGTVDALR